MSKKGPKKSELGNPKSLKRRKFVEGLINGKSMRRAALDAGYTPSMADKAGQKILPGAQHEFRDALAARIPLDRLVSRIAEGLDATETKLAQKDGKFTSKRELIAWEARRRYAELTAKLMGYLVERIELGGPDNGPLNFDVKVNFVDPQDAGEEAEESKLKELAE